MSTHNMFSSRNKKNIMWITPLICSYGNVFLEQLEKISILVAGLGGSVGCTVRLETRRSRVQPPPGSATFFRGD